MLKSLKWEDDRVLSICVGENLFTLAQMRANYLLEVFDVFRTDDSWEGVDLNSAEIIFCIFISPKNLKSIFSDRPVESSILKNQRAIRKRMLSANLGAPGSMSADLIDLSSSFSNIDGNIVRERLTPEKDSELIYKYEFCGMAGNPDRVLNRLKLYHQTGVNWDETKKVIFPDLPPPAPSR